MFVYLDNSSTTKPYPSVVRAVTRAMEADFGNPSSLHRMGLEAEQLIKEARSILARSLGASPKEIFFTSGGTESDNTALFGVWESRKRQGKRILTGSVEHPAVLRACEKLEKMGAEVIYLPVTTQGILDMEAFQEALNEDTILVSLMHVNNETGAVMPIGEVMRILKQRRIPAVFHTDAVQSYGKLDLDVRSCPVDMISLSGHKIHGPKGIGALYVRDGLVSQPFLYGGGQESGFRSGTENVPGIAGFAQAVREQWSEPETRIARITQVKDYLLKQLTETITDLSFHTPADSAPSVLNIGFVGCKGEVLLHMLEQSDIFVSTGSACSSKKSGSHVLAAMGLSKSQIEGAIRFSFSEDNDINQMDYVVEVIRKAVTSQRRLRKAFAKE
ncbi:MAG: cysteine desulfurase family protein [Eubacteriales bacterium]|nr:cysteine desulfurase family protein [Eubacteriales bacterium]MDD3290387.1 cysteine desulfurase family protein [Eubacteriales bacterium]MDD3863351.1 cysteine desulfurase family protein [Eubacteriales bacterium]MDD4444720.1 cysteine desulfurase family protein [Eubacteriales bacterium]